jgi:hypothetical protein
MYPWSADARETIKEVSDIDDALIEQTDEIKAFLHKTRYYFVTGTKGTGKSLLLMAKRRNLRGIDYMIPKDLLLDVPEVSIGTLSRNVMSFLRKERDMQLLWSISIMISIVKNLGMSDQLLKANMSDSLKYLVSLEHCVTVSSHFSEILWSVSAKQFFKDLSKDHDTFLLPLVQSINRSVAIFIDNVDECFEEAERAIWYTAQTSLVKAVYSLVRLNPRLKIFVSIRKEAFLRLKLSTEMYLQYEDVTLDLRYHKEELKEIFVRNINRDNTEHLMEKSFLRERPIYSFVGVDKIRHGYVDENEDIFDYIYRHTLRRPRDFMTIGRAISGCPTSARNPKKSGGIKKLADLVNQAATKVAEVYMNEITPHLKVDDFSKVYELIDYNVMDREQLKVICMVFNDDVSCNNRQCKECKDGTHIFCELYKIGLLGYVTDDRIRKAEFIQRFSWVGEKTFEDVGILPDAGHYLVHPILNDLISKKSNAYQRNIDDINIIGYDRPWRISKAAPVADTKPVADKTMVKTQVKEAKIKVEPPFQIDETTHRLFDKNGRQIHLNREQHAVLLALVKKIGQHPIGLLKDDFIVEILIRCGRNKDSGDKSPRSIVRQFAQSLRRRLKTQGIRDTNAIIRTLKKAGGLVPGDDWNPKRSTIYGSEASITFRRSRSD